MTPPLPDWIKEGRLGRETIAGYKAAHELVGFDEPRLYGTESMYGDWDARVMLLAKDFAPTTYLEDLIEGGCPRPYRHAPSIKANRYLKQLAASLAIGDEPSNCGLLYGSALANLCRDDGEWDGALPNRTKAMTYGSKVLRWVLTNTHRINTIVCMGAEAWWVACDCLKVRQKSQFTSSRKLKQAVTIQPDWRSTPIHLFVVFHPSARGMAVQDHLSYWAPIYQHFE